MGCQAPQPKSGDGGMWRDVDCGSAAGEGWVQQWVQSVVLGRLTQTPDPII